MLTCHLQMKMESKTMPFLDVQIIGEDKTFTTSVYRKKPSGVYTHFDGLLPSTYKFGIVHTHL